MTAKKLRVLDILLGALIGALGTGVITALTLYVQVQTINIRLASVERQLAQISRTTIVQPEQERPFR